MVAGAADADGEGTPEDVPPDGVLPLDPHPAATSARPHAIAASLHRAGLGTIAAFMVPDTLPPTGRLHLTPGGDYRLPRPVVFGPGLSAN